MSDGDFDSERGRKVALETRWQNSRKRILKENGLWEKYGEDDDE